MTDFTKNLNYIDFFKNSPKSTHIDFGKILTNFVNLAQKLGANSYLA